MGMRLPKPDLAWMVFASILLVTFVRFVLDTYAVRDNPFEISSPEDLDAYIATYLFLPAAMAKCTAIFALLFGLHREGEGALRKWTSFVVAVFTPLYVFPGAVNVLLVLGTSREHYMATMMHRFPVLGWDVYSPLGQQAMAALAFLLILGYFLRCSRGGLAGVLARVCLGFLVLLLAMINEGYSPVHDLLFQLLGVSHMYVWSTIAIVDTLAVSSAFLLAAGRTRLLSPPGSWLPLLMLAAGMALHAYEVSFLGLSLYLLLIGLELRDGGLLRRTASLTLVYASLIYSIPPILQLLGLFSL